MTERARRYRRGDVVYWVIPAGPRRWPTDGIGVIRTSRDGVHQLAEGQLLTTNEIVELIAAGDRQRTRRNVA